MNKIKKIHTYLADFVSIRLGSLPTILNSRSKDNNLSMEEERSLHIFHFSIFHVLMKLMYHSIIRLVTLKRKSEQI